MLRILRGGFDLADGLSTTTKGNTREKAVLQFLQSHLPGSLGARSGHVLYAQEPSRQQDVIVARASGLVLPVGDAGLFLPENVVACIEVKTELSKSEVADAAKKFDSLQGQQPLKVLLAGRLQNDHRYRDRVAKWIRDLDLSESSLPDLIVVLPVGAIVRGSALRVLSGFPNTPEDDSFYKFGRYDAERWAALALLVHELSARGTDVDLTQHWITVLPHHLERADPDGKHA